MLETMQTQRWSFALALLAAAITAACCAFSRVDLAMALWRCAVAFMGVWVYQRLLAEVWTVLDAEPIRVSSSDLRARR